MPDKLDAAVAALRMEAATPSVAVFPMPADVRQVDFVSDLHLCADMPATWCAFEHYLKTTSGDVLVLLGDVFEAWVGDDARYQAFEAECLAALEQFATTRPLFVMRGNRDFLLGSAFMKDCGAVDLPDPSLLRAFDETVLVTHGDALCLEDVRYQDFRRQVRAPEWQAQFLSMPLAERLALATAMRQASQASQQDPNVTHADADPALMGSWLKHCAAKVLVHGHTHRPGTEPLPAGRTRHVLSDWDLDGQGSRAEVLSWSAKGWTRWSPLQL